MLSDKLREGANGRIFKILFWVIILSFVFTGVGGYLIPRLNTDPVTVGEYTISANEWTDQYNRQTQQMQRMYGPQFTRLLEDHEYVNELRSQVLEGLIDNVAFNTAVFNTDVRIGDEQVRDAIRNTPAFMKDGKFNNDLYLASVRNMGMDPEYFGEQMRLSLTAAAISDPLSSLSSRVLPYESKILNDVLLQSRVVDLYSLDTSSLKSGMSATEEELKSWYQDHQETYMAPATVTFTYLLLDSNAIRAGLSLSDAELEEYYSLNSEDFRVGERRDMSHILIRAGDDASERAAKVQEALAAGRDFAAVASEFSDDSASKAQGGEMGPVGRNEIAANLENALFSLSEGAVSAPVSDSYGIHFIKLNRILPSYVPTFAEAREQVRQAALDARTRELYQEQVTTLSDLSFENPDSLDVTAEALKLKVTEYRGLKQGDTTAPWPLNTAAVQEAAFNEDNLTSGVNTPVVTVNDGVSVVMNISDFTERALRDFEEVKSEVEDAVLAHKAVEEGNRILNTFAKARQSDPSAPLPEGVSETDNVTLVRGDPSYDAAFGMAVFAIPAEGAERYAVGENQGKAALALLKEIKVPEESPEYAQLINAQFAQYRQADAQAALNRLSRSLTEITYNQEAIDMVNQGSAGE